MDLTSVAAAVAARLDGAHVAGGDRDKEISGTVRGRAVTVHCHHRPSTRTPGTSGWKVSVSIPPTLPVTGSVRRRTPGDQRDIDRGTLLAVTTGDAGFDAAWLVEGTPRALLASLFDAAVRDALERYGRIEHRVNHLPGERLDPEVSIAPGTLSMAYGQPFEAADVCGAVELLAMLGDRAAAIAAEREAAPPSAEQLAAESSEHARQVAVEQASSARTTRIIGVGLALAAAAWLALQLSDCFR